MRPIGGLFGRSEALQLGNQLVPQHRRNFGLKRWRRICYFLLATT